MSLYCLRYLDKSYRETLDLLSEIPQILDNLDHSTLVKAFDRHKISLSRVLLRLSTQLYNPNGTPGILVRSFNSKMLMN